MQENQNEKLRSWALCILLFGHHRGAFLDFESVRNQCGWVAGSWSDLEPDVEELRRVKRSGLFSIVPVLTVSMPILAPKSGSSKTGLSVAVFGEIGFGARIVGPASREVGLNSPVGSSPSTKVDLRSGSRPPGLPTGTECSGSSLNGVSFLLECFKCSISRREERRSCSTFCSGFLIRS